MLAFDPNLIDHRHPEFLTLCTLHRVEYPTTVHHFEPDKNQRHKPVLWCDAKIDSSSTERILADG